MTKTNENNTDKTDRSRPGAVSAGAGYTSWGLWLAIVALFGGIALLLWSWSSPQQAGRAPPVFSGEFQQFIPSREPRPAPQAGFAAGDGRPATVAEWRGRVVLVNFWATWCVPCVAEMAALDRLQAALGAEGLTVLAISQDRGGIDVVRPFYDKLGLRHIDAWLDPQGRAARDFAVTGVPVTLVIDRQGREVGRLAGPAAWDSAAAVALLRHYLAMP